MYRNIYNLGNRTVLYLICNRTTVTVFWIVIANENADHQSIKHEDFLHVQIMCGSLSITT